MEAYETKLCMHVADLRTVLIASYMVVLPSRGEFVAELVCQY